MAAMDAAVHFKAQVAALPVKGTPGNYEVLLVTSRESHRWVIPKGWPMKGRKDHEAAAREAFEEAGVAGRIHKHPMGAYTYEKHLPAGVENVRVMVYLLEVDKESRWWPEVHEREREWLVTSEAIARVEEAGLAEIIKRLDVSSLDFRD